MAARSVLAGVARDFPKSGLDTVKIIRVLKIIKNSAMKALIVTAPLELRHQLAGFHVSRLVARCARFRSGHLSNTSRGLPSTPSDYLLVVMPSLPLRYTASIPRCCASPQRQLER